MKGEPVTEREIYWLKQLLARGFSPVEAAQRMGISPRRVNTTMARYVTLPAHYILLTDLAVELGITAYMLRNHATRGILPANRWAGRLVYTRDQAEAVRAYYAEHGEQDTPWLTAAQAARELGCDPPRLHRVRDRIAAQQGLTIRRKKLKGVSGNVWRYHPGDVQAAARRQPRLFRGRPRDHVSSKVLAEMAGMLTPCPPSGWAAKGCPHVRDHLRRLWFRPAEVLAWLNTRPPHRQTRSAAAHLAAALKMESAA